jgi:hypothetical protein
MARRPGSVATAAPSPPVLPYRASGEAVRNAITQVEAARLLDAYGVRWRASSPWADCHRFLLVPPDVLHHRRPQGLQGEGEILPAQSSGQRRQH